MESQTTIPAPPAAAFPGEGFRAPLPGMTMGDAGVSVTRRHEWPGRLFIAISFATAGALGLGVPILAAFIVSGGLEPRLWVRLGAMAVWAVLQWRLSREVSRFSRWGWFGAMAELGAASLAKVAMAVVAPFTAPSALVMLAINGAWMRYFWRRRAQFDVDLGN